MAVQERAHQPPQQPPHAAEADPAAQAAYAGTFAQAAAAPGVGGGTLINTLSMLNRTNLLGQKADAFLEQLKKHLEGTGMNIQILALSQPAGARAVVAGDYAILLIFADVIGVRPAEYVPVSEYIGPAADNLRAIYPQTQFKILNGIVLIEADYDRVAQWAQHLHRVLFCAVHPEAAAANVGDIGSQNLFTVDASLETVRGFIAQHHPHAVMPRVEFGFLVSVQLPKPPGARTQQTPLLEDSLPLLAVGAFTEMIRYPMPDGTIKYIPFVRITNMTAALPLASMVMLGATLSTDRFVLQQGWRQQFSTFQPGKPNIGNLAKPDQNDPAFKNKPVWFAANVMERDAFIGQNCTPPVIALDVVEGQARIPAISQYPNPAQHERIREEMMRFFGVAANQLPVVNGPLAHVDNTDYIGAVGQVGGGLIDSRYYTYLDIVAQQGAVTDDKQVLLHYQLEPKRRAAVVADVAPGFQSLYKCLTTTLHKDLLGWLSAMLANTMRITQQGGLSGIATPDFAVQQAMTGYVGFTPMMQNRGATPFQSGIYYTT